MILPHQHRADPLDRDNLERSAKRILDTGDGKRLFNLCGGTPREQSLAVMLFLRAFQRPMKKCPEEWEELSLSWPIPRGSYKSLVVRASAFVQPFLAGGGCGFRTVSLPLAEDLDVLTLSFVRVA